VHLDLDAFVARVDAAGVTTVHVFDTYVLADTPDGQALPVWTDADAGVVFARAAVEADPLLRLAVLTWPSAALGPLAEHARRAGWRLGPDWDPAGGIVLDGPVVRAEEVLDALAAAGTSLPSREAPIDGRLGPGERRHVWDDGAGVRVDLVAPDGSPRG
jgi:hypothetical protein